ncbi:hypothetical protein BC829DRAFT_438898 [Chytridium lagenaria]|nr:hypothetical protein BC829DRAFT_438898 [Chytridium lagenaria]
MVTTRSHQSSTVKQEEADTKVKQENEDENFKRERSGFDVKHERYSEDEETLKSEEFDIEHLDEHFTQVLETAVKEAGSKTKVQALEYGKIYFMYRPRVNLEHAKSIDDVQRFFMLLCPVGQDMKLRKDYCRLMVIGKKRLPRIDIETKQHEKWVVPGLGILSVIQRELGIHHEGSFHLSVKVPDDMMGFFGSRRFVSVNPTRLLDCKGIEVLLIAAHDNIVEDFEEQGEVLEKVGKDELKAVANPEECPLKELHLAKQKFKTEALLGQWI